MFVDFFLDSICWAATFASPHVNQSALSLSLRNMKYFQKLLLIWMIVWLPVAGAMAAVMPLSGTMTSVAASKAASVDADDMAVVPCHGDGKLVPGKNTFGQGCTHCVLCHLAGALVLPEMPIIPMIAPTNIFITALANTPSSFVAEPPRHLRVTPSPSARV